MKLKNDKFLCMTYCNHLSNQRHNQPYKPHYNHLYKIYRTCLYNH